MKTNRLLEALGDVDERFIEEATPSKNKTVYPWGILLALASSICLILSVLDMLNQTDLPIEPPTSATVENEQVSLEPITFASPKINGSEHGVTIEAIDIAQQNFDETPVPTFFIYKNKCYVYFSTVFSTKENQIHLYDHNTFLEQYVGKSKKVDINTFKKRPYTELTGTITREFFTVKGIDSTFMLCSRSKADENYIDLWLNSSDISLKKGADLFENLLHLNDNCKQVTYLPNHAHYQWEISKINQELPDVHVLLYQDYAVVSRFLEGLNEGTFIYPQDVAQNEASIIEGNKTYAIIIQLTNDLCIPLTIYEDGYVRLEGFREFSNLLVKVDQMVVQELIEVLNQKDNFAATNSN